MCGGGHAERVQGPLKAVTGEGDSSQCDEEEGSTRVAEERRLGGGRILWIKDLNVGPEIIELLEENHRW